MAVENAPRRGRRSCMNRRTVYLLDAMASTVPRNDDRGRIEDNGQTAIVEVMRHNTSTELKEMIQAAFSARGVRLRAGEWEYLQCNRSNYLVTLPGPVDGNKFLSKYKRGDASAYIRWRQSLAPVVNGHRRVAPGTPAAASGSNEQGRVSVQNEVVLIDDDPAAPVQLDENPAAVQVQESIFQQVAEDTGSLVSRRPEELRDMLAGWEGPHVAAICCSGAGTRRPSPMPLTPTAAEHICREQERPLITVLGLTEEAEDTSLARVTTTPGYFQLFQERTGRRRPLQIHLNSESTDGIDYMRRYEIQKGNLPALVVTMQDKEPIVIRTKENGEMEGKNLNGRSLQTVMEDFCSVFVQDSGHSGANGSAESG